MHLLVLNYEYPPLGGGSSPVTAALCRQLSRQGIDIDIVTMAYGSLPRTEEHEGVTIHRVPGLRSSRHICYTHELFSYMLPAYRKAMALARERPFDMIHAHFVVPSSVVAYSLSKKLKIPYVITTHGSDVPGYNPDRFRRIHRAIGPIWRKIVGNAAKVTSPSHLLAGLIRKAAASPLPIEIIPNAIDSNWNEPGEMTPKILIVSRLFERKGIQYLLQVLRDHPIPFEVHIVGEGPMRERLEKMTSGQQSRIVFHGWLDNDSQALKELYQSAAIFVFPSEAENFPMCLLEAMVSGCAIVASDIPGCREVLEESAVYFPPGDIASLGEILVELTQDRARVEDFGRRARERVVTHLSWAAIGRRYHDLFLSVLEKN